MIISELQGGLGNQLFQYAMARYLTEKHQTKLMLELSCFRKDKLRNYELSHFNIQQHFIERENFLLVKRYSKLRKRARLKIKSFLLRKPLLMLACEEQFNFDKTFLSLPDNIYLRGYWQSEKYFKSITNILKQEFTLKNQLTQESQAVADCINTCKTTISLHIRRGDYVSNQEVAVTQGVCSLIYYQKAVSYLEQQLGSLNLFIFSDDAQWVKENLKFDHSMTFITHNGAQRAYEDMHLMSLCQHNIIANSSFSWWGAWLNNNLSKIVIAPKKWFIANHLNSEDICPESWIRL